MHSLGRWFQVFLLTVATTSSLLAQRAVESPVYVHDSGVASEKLALAAKLEHLSEWDKSADLYLEVVGSYGDCMLAAEGDERRYVSVVSVVQDRLARWPADGVAAFRDRFEPTASAALEAAGHDSAALQTLLAKYFVTDSAKRAAQTLIDDLLESGQFDDAAARARQLLDHHPMLNDVDRAQLLFRLGVAAHGSGESAVARDVLKQLAAKYPDAIGQINGSDMPLKNALAAILAEPATQPTLADDRWLTPLGNTQRNRVVRQLQFGGARMGYRDVEMTAPHGIQAPTLRDWQRQLDAARLHGFCTGIFPVIDRGELFYQDNARLYAINLASGEPLPGWAASYPETNGIYTIADAWPLPIGQPCLLTLTDDSVYATMGLMDFAAAQYVGMVGAHSTHLVCLNRRDGQPRWTIFSQQLPENLSNLDLAGCPLVLGSTVYVQAHGSHGQFDDAYLLAFDRNDGSFRWSCYISSANLPNADMDPSAGTVPCGSVIATDGGGLVVQTNNGVLAKINPATGSIQWLSLYPREALHADGNDLINAMTRRQTQLGPRRPWEHNPPIVENGRIYAMPDDGNALLVYDADTGAMLKRVLMSDFDSSRTLLGVSGNQVVLHSVRKVFCIDWTKYPDNAQPTNAPGGDPPARARESITWATNDLKKGGQVDVIRGRGVVSGDSVVIPTVWQLMRFSMTSGLLKTAYPTLPNNQWGDDEGPGNLLFAGDQLIVAGASGGGAMRVSWYTDLDQALKKLDAAQAAAPERFEPRLHYAQALFTAGQIPAATTKLDEAIARASASSTDAASKTRLYAAAVEFARRAGSDPSGDPKIVDGFFDRAAPYITSPQQQVDFRLMRADFERDRKRPAEQLALYQQILSDPAWRSVAVLRGDENTTAGAVAAELIASVGSTTDAYAPIEQAAQAALAKAQSNQNVAALKEVADAYPNSSVAGKAINAAAEQAQFSGDLRQAVDLFRRGLGAAEGNDEQRRLLTRMAQCYVQLPGGLETAASRLRQAGRLAGGAKMAEPLTLPDGKSVPPGPFADAAAAVHATAAATPALPDCAIPLNRRKKGGGLTDPFAVVDVAAAGSYRSLIDCVDNFTRNDRLVAEGAGGVAVFKPGVVEPLFRTAAVKQVLHAAWIGGNLALVEPRVITFVGGDNGEKQWQASLSDIGAPQRLVVAENLPPAMRDDSPDATADFQPNFARIAQFRRIRRFNPVAAMDDPNDTTEQFRLVAPLQDRIICSTSSGRILAFGLAGGKLLWQARVSEHATVRLLASDDFVVVQTGDAAPLTILSALTGEIIQRGRLADRRLGNNVINLALSPDGMLVVLNDTSLLGKDLFEPSKLAQPTYQFPAHIPPGNNGQIFSDPASPVIADRIIYTLSDGGTHLRMFSLDDGSPVPFNQAPAVDTGTRGSPLELAADSGRCYVASENWVKGFDLTHQTAWPLRDVVVPQIREIALTQSHLMALADQPPGEANRRSARRSELQLYSRGPDKNGAESGLLEYRYALPEHFAPTDWQPVDGGVYLLSNDRRLIFLAGQRGTEH